MQHEFDVCVTEMNFSSGDLHLQTRKVLVLDSEYTWSYTGTEEVWDCSHEVNSKDLLTSPRDVSSFTEWDRNQKKSVASHYSEEKAFSQSMHRIELRTPETLDSIPTKHICELFEVGPISDREDREIRLWATGSARSVRAESLRGGRVLECGFQGLLLVLVWPHIFRISGVHCMTRLMRTSGSEDLRVTQRCTPRPSFLTQTQVTSIPKILSSSTVRKACQGHWRSPLRPISSPTISWICAMLFGSLETLLSYS